MEVIINFKWLIIVSAIVILFYFLKECFFKEKDTKITTDLISKYPNVDPAFIRKAPREQLVDLNIENHSVNQKLETQDLRITAIEENQRKILQILEELQKNGTIR